MQPIIDPKIFYFIHLFENIRLLSFITIAFLSVALVLILADCCLQEDIKQLKIFIHNKKTILILIISILLLLFIPSKDTMITMLISQNITIDNINSVKGQVFEIVDYIVKNLK